MKYPTFPITIRIILLSIILGGASGALATAIVSSSLSDYTIQLNEQTRPLQTTDRTPKAFPSSYADATNRFVDDSFQSLATVFLKSGKGSFGYGRDAIVTTGVVFTSDGWIAIANAPTVSPDQLSVKVKQVLYDVTRVATDPVTNITFLKIQASNLPVIGFGKAFELSMGQQIFAVTNAGSLINASVRALVWPQGVVVSSDVPSRRLSISLSLAEVGNPAFDLSGAFVGFILKHDAEMQLLPLEDVLPALTSLLEKKTIVRSSFGAQYIDIAHTVGLPEKFMRGHVSGAYLTGHPAVKKGSGAALAGLNEGDIVLSVNGQNIDESNGLDERLLPFHPGDTVMVAIDRLGEKKTVNVVLGEYGK